MRVEESIGISPCRVWCPRCGLGKIIGKIEDTKGEVPLQLESMLTARAAQHETHHPKHTDITVFIYRQQPPASE